MKRFLAWLPVFCLFLFWFAYASPYFLKSKVPFPSTYQVNNFAPWDAYPQFGSPVKNGAMPDIITQIYPWKHFTIQSWKQGQIPLWNPNSFAGTPHLANYQSAALTPLNLLFFIMPFIDAWSILILLQPLLAGIFMYWYVRSLRMGKIASLISAISFMFCGFITVWMDYGTLGYAILFLPLALFAIEKYQETLQFRWLWLLAVTIPLSLFSGHFQTSGYFLLFIFIYLLYKLFASSQKKQLLPLFIVYALGIILALPQILPAIEFYSQSLRSNLYSGVEVIPWSYLPTFLAPDFFGNPVTRNDWFGHYAEWNAYIGVLPLMLAFYALKERKNSFIVFLGGTACIIILLAFPSPLLQLLIALHLPVLSTSSASRIIVLFSFIAAVLAGFGFEILFRDIVNKKNKAILVWIGFFAFVFLFLWLMVIGKLFLPIAKIAIAKQNLILPTALFLEIVFSIIVAASLTSKIKQKLLAIVTCILLLTVAFDMFRFATKWQAFDPKNLAFINVPVTNYFPNISGYHRVIGNIDASASVYYNLPSLEGYDPLYIRRYGELIASVSDGKRRDADRSVVTFPKTAPIARKMIDFLDGVYILHKSADTNTTWTFPYWQYPSSEFSLLYDDGAYRIYRNNQAFPHAFVVSSYQIITDPQQIIAKMVSPKTNLQKEILLEKNPGFRSSSSKNGQATIVNYSANSITIHAHVSTTSLLFLSDSYYPGWNAYVDGKQVEILRADFAFRAVVLPAGNHMVVFSYQPISFWLGVYAAIIALAGIVVVSFFLYKKKNNIES